MRDKVEHLRLDTEHPVHGRKTNYLREGWKATIGSASAEQLGKRGREHIQVHGRDVSEIHGQISVENGSICYTHLTDKPTRLIDADRKEAGGFYSKGFKVRIDPSQSLIFGDTKISFKFEILEVIVNEPEQVRAQVREIKLDEILKKAGARNAEVVKTFIDHLSKIIEKEKEAGKLGMGIDKNMNYVKGGMWVEGSLVHLPKEGQAILVGDIHSSPHCLEHILRETNFVERASKGEKVYLVFMGDYSDRPMALGDGPKVLETVLELKTRFTNNVVLLRGNHDAPIVPISPREFPGELKAKYGEKEGPDVESRYMGFFEKLPLAVKMENGIFVTHAGAASTVKSLSDVINPSRQTIIQMTWNDPKPYVMGYVINSERSFTELDSDKAFVFGSDAAESFLNNVGSRVMVRAHEQKVQHDFNGKCLTLNSTDYRKRKYNIETTQAYAVVNLSQEIYNTSQIELHYF
jgi:hypothetical protein